MEEELKREQYLKYRVEKNYAIIIYHFVYENDHEKKLPVLPIPTFMAVFQTWLSTISNEHFRNDIELSINDLFTDATNIAIRFYDYKFGVTELIVEEKKEIKQKVTFLL